MVGEHGARVGDSSIWLGGGAGGNLRTPLVPARIVVEHGVTIIGWFKPGQHRALSRQPNVRAETWTAFLLHLVKDGKLQLNMDDEKSSARRIADAGAGKSSTPRRVREFFSLPPLPGLKQRRWRSHEAGLAYQPCTFFMLAAIYRIRSHFAASPRFSIPL